MSREAPIKWPLVMPACKVSNKPALNISRLNPQQKQQVWAAIKQERPALFELLMMINPREFQEQLIASAQKQFLQETDRLSPEQLQRQFGAELIVDLDQLPESVHHLRNVRS